MFRFARSLALALLPLSIAARDIQARELNTNLTKNQATWALARISSGRSPLVNQDPKSRDFVYRYNPRFLGNGTQAFVISSGCNVEAPDLQTRTANIGDFPTSPDFSDMPGYGTELASIIGGQYIGVATQAVLNCIKVMKYGQLVTEVKDIVDAIGLALDVARDTKVPSVIVIGPLVLPSQELDNAVTDALAKGIPVITPAGTQQRDAKNYSPARVPGVICVGATDIGDKMANSSNFGDAVTLFAPGVDAFSGYFEDRLSNTAVAAGYVAGVALGLMSSDGRQWSPDELKQGLTKLALQNVITGIPSDTPNLLLNNGFTT